MHPTRFTLAFGKYGPHGVRRLKDGKGLAFAFIPPDSLGYQLEYTGLWKTTRDQINKYFDFLHSDPGYLFWPIRDRSGHFMQRLEDIYDKDVGYLEWFVNNDFSSKVLKPLVVDYMKYREALSGGFKVPELSDFKDSGFSPLEQMTGEVIQFDEPFHMTSELSGSVHISETFRVRVVKKSKPSGWYVPNPDKTSQEEIDSALGLFKHKDKNGVERTDKLWIPPRAFTQYRSDLFFVSHYKTQEGYKSRTPLKEEDRLSSYIQLMEDIDLMGDGVEDVSMLLDRVRVCCKHLWSWYEIEKKQQVPVPAVMWSACLVRDKFSEIRREIVRKFEEVFDRLTGPQVITYYEDNEEHNDILMEEDEVELSPQDEAAVSSGEIEIEDLLPEHDENEVLTLQTEDYYWMEDDK